MIEMIKDKNLDSINLVMENLEELLSEFKSCVSKSVEKNMHQCNYQKHLLEIVNHGITKNYRPLKDQSETG